MQRHPEQPAGAAVALRARRRVHRRPAGPYLQVRGRWRRGAGQHPASAARLRTRWLARPGPRRGGNQARRFAFRQDAIAVPGKHPGRQGAFARLPQARARVHAQARAGSAPGWRAHFQRGGGAGRAGARNRRARRHRDVLPFERAGRSRGFHSGRPGRAHGQRPALPQASGRRHGAGGRAGGGRSGGPGGQPRETARGSL